VSKDVRLPFPVNASDSTEIEEVYPNSLINMRDQVIDTVGQIAPPLIPVLPAWMTSKQPNGRVLGFTPAWVIAYVKPGESDRVAYNIQEIFGDQLNLVDYKVDRYELDRSQTYQWDEQDDQWLPQPPAATTFDTFQQPAQLVDWQNNATQEITWRNIGNLPVFWLTPSQGLPQTGTVFDGGSTRFITPTVQWRATDEFDKYLVFPRTNILE
jgi:hypothetical protein